MWAGKACRHRTETGCGIYADRPENPCKIFQCGWLNGTLPEDESFKPNHCGAIVLTDRKQAGWDVWRVVPVGRSVPEATLEKITTLAGRRSSHLSGPSGLRTMPKNLGQPSRSQWGQRLFLQI
ncbi:MAG: hypothetical protein CM15mP74_36440 [Halieaceae bacterium]|nr:MAG: hypothetical protein CM15mP74_36440 [Halieaceae bacterium]